MTASEIINAILEFEQKTAAQFAEEIGLGRPQGIYDVQKGKVKNISIRLANLIRHAKPIYRKEWLLTGEGDMIDATVEDKEPLHGEAKVDSLSVINKLVMLNENTEKDIQSLRDDISILSSKIEALSLHVMSLLKETQSKK